MMNSAIYVFPNDFVNSSKYMASNDNE